MKPGTATLFFLLSITAAANGQLYMYFVNALQDLMKNPAFLKEVAAKQPVAQPAAQPADSDVALDGGMIWKASKDVEKLIKVTGFNIFPPSSSASPSSSSSLSSSSSSHSTSSSAAPTSSSSSISASSAISPAQEIKPMPPRTSLDIGAEPQANENELESIQLRPQAILPHQFQLNPMQQQQQPNPLLQQQQPNPLLQQQQPNPLFQQQQPNPLFQQQQQPNPLLQQEPQPNPILQQQQPNPLLQQQPNPLQEEPQPNPQPTINIPEGMSARDYLKTVPHLKYHSGEEANFNLRRRYFARQRRV